MKNLLRIELSPHRIYGLDILRALAIMFVLGGHGEYLMTQAQFKYVNLFILDGVSIFFVLSGFLIGGILIKTLKGNIISTKLIFNFWIRRWFRTIPNYFLVLVILLLLSYFFREQFSIMDKKRYFLFSQNLITPHPVFFPEAWSLSIEEWFYLCVPIATFLFVKIFKLSIDKSLLSTAIIIIVGATMLRFYRYYSLKIYDVTGWDTLLRKQVFTRLDSLMFGVVGAYVYMHFKKAWYKNRIPLFIVGIALFVSVKFNLFGFPDLGLFYCVFFFSTISVATLFVMPYFSSIKSGKGFIYKYFTYISLISYSMYLINFSIVQKWIIGNIDWSFLQSVDNNLLVICRYLVYWIITIVISILMYKYFELPVMNLRDKVKADRRS